MNHKKSFLFKIFFLINSFEKIDCKFRIKLKKNLNRAGLWITFVDLVFKNVKIYLLINLNLLYMEKLKWLEEMELTKVGIKHQKNWKLEIGRAVFVGYTKIGQIKILLENTATYTVSLLEDWQIKGGRKFRNLKGKKK